MQQLAGGDVYMLEAGLPGSSQAPLVLCDLCQQLPRPQVSAYLKRSCQYIIEMGRSQAKVH